MLREFAFPIAFSVVCLALSFAWAGPRGLFLAVILSVLELSLSFDNAVVNASVLQTMSAVWRRRFLTWGIAIGVFGMRLIFPILIVALVARLGIPEVVRLAFGDPEGYARHLEEASVTISAFGGMFLLMVFLDYVLDPGKREHWIAWLERRLAAAGKLDSLAIVIGGAVLLAVTQFLVAPEERFTALAAGLVGILLYTLMTSLTGLFGSEASGRNLERVGLMTFMYLEVRDASFSLDGVIGAFAITQDVVIIAVGLGIGAVFIRGMTLALVNRGALKQFRFLEHGAHYGILALASIMLISLRYEIPELVTGLIGVAFIGFAILSSVLANRRSPSSGALGERG